ncbi:hypothetical protein [Azospirillum melinis]
MVQGTGEAEAGRGNAGTAIRFAGFAGACRPGSLTIVRLFAQKKIAAAKGVA